MSEKLMPSGEFSSHSHISSMEQYRKLYRRSLDDPAGFWGEQAKQRLTWMKRWDSVGRWDFDKAEIAWFEGGELNVSANCLDRHLATRGDQTALIWEGDDPAEDRHITYRELHEEVCRFANVLKANGVQRGDRVTIYLPMIPALPVAMLACARIGAVHSVIFGGFSPHSIRDRIEDCRSDLVITADEGRRGGKQMAEYVGLFDPRLQGLTGTEAEIRHAARGYKVYYYAGNVDGTYVVDHTAYPYLVGPDGRIG